MIQEYFPTQKKKNIEPCAKNNKLDEVIGFGEFGVVYNTNKPNFVLKKIRLNGDLAFQNFTDEVEIGILLGKLKIAPTIKDAWYCSYTHYSIEQTNGYIVMQKILDTWEDKYGFNYGTTQSHQSKLIKKIDLMLINGYIHNDIHPGNVGFVKNTPKQTRIASKTQSRRLSSTRISRKSKTTMDDKTDVVLFDFGLTKKIDTNDEKNKYYNPLFASQLYIFIEQFNREDMFSTNNLIYSEIEKRLKSTQFYQPRPIIDITITDFPKITLDEQKSKINTVVTEIQQLALKNNLINVSLVMLRLYQIIESYSVFESYSHEFDGEDYYPGYILDLIYKIRRGTIKTLEDVVNSLSLS